MDKLGIEELRDLLQSLNAISKCAVCLHILKPDTVVCVNGHVICRGCKEKQATCPTCRKGFSNIEQPSFIRQILEVIPHTCRHEKCTYLVKKGDFHEKYCSFRFTNCKACNWEGHVKDLRLHWSTDHSQNQIFSKSLIARHSFSIDRKRGPNYLLCELNGHFLWNKNEYDPNAGVMIDSFIPVLNGRPADSFFVKLIFASGRKQYDFGIKVEVDSEEEDENRVYVPITVLQHFWNKGNMELKYDIEVSKSQ